ncbi:trafficking protein particle complex subunit 10-like [Littorina saxatilis]|uniref:Trafficking protein particle complex subunit 10 n=1 Tax=Littorina saxatilis TaxID=31220 RepID=A0AAN9BJH8_9CAEN
MEAKPIITCHGNQTLFSSLHPAVVNGLPKDVCEWRRSFGRAPRSVQLEGSFVPYDPDILPEEDTKTLVSRPYFHIYWTDCDLDSYKQTVRDDLAEWQAALKARSIPDWMIVVVVPDESKVKAKILPRSSVIDKVRSDFCSKQPDRSVVLIEPLKAEQKSVESWNQFFHKLRALLLQAYNRHLNKYEENMRSLREKRNEAGWTYFDYFSVQEELGFMLEVLGLREDALIQYDELDAMFDQFVENHASGAPVTWLSPLVKPCTSWSGLSLAKPIDLDLRDRVKRTLTSLLEFRNYLFCRQAALLFAMGRAWEVAERAFDFLRNTVSEMKALEVKIPEGGLQCWVVLSGLEVLAACQKHETGQVDRCSIFTAHLWDYIRAKLKELGQLCSLMPGMEPTSEQLNQVLDLKGGMALSHDQETVGDVPPVDKLHEALSSPGLFKKHYLEMCELAMGTYKHISRFRSARKIGRELANFYMKIGEPQKAEGFLMDAVKMYGREGWDSLSHATMRELAACQKLMGDTKRFVVTACNVAGSSYLPDADRKQHLSEALQVLDSDDRVELGGSRLIDTTQLRLNKPTVKVDDEVSMTIHLHSHFPQPLTCDSVHLALSPCLAHHMEEASNQSDPPLSQEAVTVTMDTHTPSPSCSLRRGFPHNIQAKALYEQRQGRLVASGITSDVAFDLLKRTDSVPMTTELGDAVVRADYENSLCATSVSLRPGDNELTLTMKAREEGWYSPSQMCVSVKGLEILLPVATTALRLHVACYRPAFTLTPNHTDAFVAGIEQAGTLTLHTGSQSMEHPTSATLQCSNPVTITPTQGGTGGQVSLPPQPPHSTISVDVSVFLPLHAATGDDGSVCAPQVECRVEGWGDPVQGNMSFVVPLSASHRVYTARDKKYIQIRLESRVGVAVTVTKPQVSGRGATFTFLNPGDHWVVCGQQTVSLVWEVTADRDQEETEVSVTFTCDFACDLDLAKELRTFSYSCCLGQFQTWYVVEYNLSGEATITAPVPGTQLSSRSMKVAGFQSGITYPLYLTVTPVTARCSAPRHQQLVYRVTADSTVWALAGKTTGVFSVGEKPFRASLRVIPLAAGYQHLPRVQLYRHKGAKPSAADIWVKRAEAECRSIDSEEDSPPSEEPDLEEDLDPNADLEDFSRGRVYNASLAKQVHVFPTPASSDIEVTMVTE